MIATKAVPDEVAWGSYPALASNVTSDAAQTYNVLVHPFSQCQFKGIIFLANSEMVADDQGAQFGEQVSALANCWKDRFGGDDPHFYFTMPSESLAPRITTPEQIQGDHTAIKLERWSDFNRVIETVTK